MNRLTLLLLFLTAGPFAHSYSVLEKDMNASVVLHIKNVKHVPGKPEQRQYFDCSGTYVQSQLILTAAHCVEGPEEQVWAKGPNEHFGYPVHLLAWDKKRDLALLFTPLPHPYVKLGKEPRRGDYVLNIGSPFEFEFVPSEGIVGEMGLHMPGYKSTYLITTAMANPGSSGGGCFDRNGNLIGVNTMIVGLFGWQGITCAVDLPTIRQFVSDTYTLYAYREK